MIEQDSNNLDISFPVETPRKKSPKKTGQTPHESNESKDPRQAVAESVVKSIDCGSPQNNANLVAILSVILGSMGVHDFLCGNTRNGAIKLICTFLGVTAFISIVWNLIDLYRIGCGTYPTKNGMKLVPCPWCKKIVLVMAIFYIAVFSIFLTQLLHFLKFV